MLMRFTQRGMSLVELMVGLVVGLIVLAGAGAMYITTVRGQTDALRAAKLNQDLRAVVNLIAADVRRAGYWQGSVVLPAGADPKLTFPSNPYTRSGAVQTDLSVLNNGTCVMYSYDAGLASADVEPGEIFGFRRVGSVIEMLDPDPTENTLVETSDCAVGEWLELTTQDTLVVDSLIFSTTGSQCMNATQNLSWRISASGVRTSACFTPGGSVTMNVAGKTYVAPVTGDLLSEVRQLTISLTGHHASDPDMASTITEIVHLGNNRILQAP